MTPNATDQQYNPVRDNNNNERCPTQATVSYYDDGKYFMSLVIGPR